MHLISVTYVSMEDETKWVMGRKPKRFKKKKNDPPNDWRGFVYESNNAI